MRREFTRRSGQSGSAIDLKIDRASSGRGKREATSIHCFPRVVERSRVGGPVRKLGLVLGDAGGGEGDLPALTQIGALRAGAMGLSGIPRRIARKDEDAGFVGSEMNVN